MNTQDYDDFNIDSLIDNYVANNPNSISDKAYTADTKIEAKEVVESKVVDNKVHNNALVPEINVPIKEESNNQNSISSNDVLPEAIKILTIDDDKWIQRIFSQYLQQWGFKHFMAIDPYLGLTEAMKQQPHLIFLDLIMPDVSGEILLQFLKNLEITKNIPVVIISGNLNKEVLRNTYIHGAKGFISKPFNQDILFSKIKEVIDTNLFNNMVEAGRIIPNSIKKKPHI